MICKLWNVAGTIRLSDEGSSIENTLILIRPPDQCIYPDGRFFINNLLLRNKEIEKASFVVHKEGFKPKTLIIYNSSNRQNGPSDYHIKFLEGAKTINIEDPIVLEQAPRMVPYREKEADRPIPTGEGK